MSLLRERIKGDVIVDVRYPDTKTFQQVIDALSKIMDEANMYFTPEGVKVRGFDPAQTSYIDLYIPSTTFLEYNISSEDAKIGFNVTRLAGILKRGMKGDPLRITATYDRVLVEIEGIVYKRYSFPNIEIAEPEVKEPKFEHTVEATIISDPLKKILKDVEAFSNIMELEALESEGNPRLTIRAFTEDPTMGKMESHLTPESAAVISLEVRENANAKYDLAFIKAILNLTRIADSVELKFSDERPLELVFKTADDSRVRYITAPLKL
ncbi:MAG: DNA polymerase sliding clamp [Desulfurococcales archaeon]|nr:DNA polymerase sliding clamp [Desulfurococcales archaeon]MEB3845886.1 DNA polymerase sliding clamp [Desulfurococcales archaeon]